MAPRDPDGAAQLAATVILLRDAPAGVGAAVSGDAAGGLDAAAGGAAGGIEVWLLRRVRALAFAGGASVFPGGRVDPADFVADPGLDSVVPGDPIDDRGPVLSVPSLPVGVGVGVGGGDGSALAGRFGCSPEQARASMMAAIRETFEETGVLLTRPAFAAGDDGRRLQDQRRRVEAHELAFPAVLASLGVAVDTELIRPWAHWITPAGEPRRFDTHFYVAALPAGATAYPETTEASAAGWITPAAALAEHARGTRAMLPPTLVALSELTAFACVADVLAASSERSLAAIVPELVTTADGQVTARLPDGRCIVLREAGS
jgi:8-oxo-dGTP pyrophosphatase MutT (NUDIX family)